MIIKYLQIININNYYNLKRNPNESKLSLCSSCENIFFALLRCTCIQYLELRLHPLGIAEVVLDHRLRKHGAIELVRCLCDVCDPSI